MFRFSFFKGFHCLPVSKRRFRIVFRGISYHLNRQYQLRLQSLSRFCYMLIFVHIPCRLAFWLYRKPQNQERPDCDPEDEQKNENRDEIERWYSWLNPHREHRQVSESSLQSQWDTILHEFPSRRRYALTLNNFLLCIACLSSHRRRSSWSAQNVSAGTQNIQRIRPQFDSSAVPRNFYMFHPWSWHSSSNYTDL